MDQNLSLILLFTGLVCTVICEQLYFDIEECLTVSSNECTNTTLYCTSEGTSFFASISLTSDYKEIAYVNPPNVRGLCPRKWALSVCGNKEIGHTIISAIPEPYNSSIRRLNAAFLHVNVNKVRFLEFLSGIVGWIYFLAWSISFYPQIYTNYVRQSVVGLNFDFLSLNIVGFTLYSLFNCGLYYVPSIQNEYLKAHPRGLIPVLFNDVFFSVHAVVLVLITILQCCKYENGCQRVSRVAKGIILIYVVILSLTGTMAFMGTITWLDFLYYCSYIKLSTTLIKYIPQAYMNYSRKSTEGWSIANIFLDFTGGALSVLQMLINGYNYNDWESIFGDFTKFGLGAFSIFFDLFFMYQHYVLYRDNVWELSGM